MNDLDDKPLNRGSWSFNDITGQPKEWTPIRKPRLVSASGMVNPLDDLLRVDASGGAVTLTLETAMGCDGRQHTFKKIDASGNAVTADGFGSETIDNAATKATSTQNASFTIKSNGVGWDLVGAFP